MNGTIKVAALAALMASAAAYANEDPSQAQQPATTGTQASDTQWPEFSTLDANGDGYVSREEARSNAGLSGSFSDLDADKNGSLSSTEYQKGKDMQKPQSSEPTSPDQSATPEETSPTTPPQK